MPDELSGRGGSMKHHAPIARQLIAMLKEDRELQGGLDVIPDRRQLDVIVEVLKEMYTPDDWRYLYPKRILSPSGYSPSIYRPVHITTALLALEITGQPGAPSMSALISAAVSAKYGFPTYYIQEDLALAMLQTDPPGDLKVADIPFPFPAMTLMLPRTPPMIKSFQG